VVVAAFSISSMSTAEESEVANGDPKISLIDLISDWDLLDSKYNFFVFQLFSFLIDE